MAGTHSKTTSGLHRPYNWVVADAAARTALTGFTSDDLYKLCLQLDTTTTYALTATTPTWTAVAGSVPDADATTKGILKLAGALTGTAASPALATDSVGASQISAGAVGSSELATDAVTNVKVANDAIDTAEIVNVAVTTAKIADGAVTSAKIADGTITDTDVATANKDGTTSTPSLRTLGTSSIQAAAGNHTHGAGSTGMSNPMTAEGDIIRGGASGVETRVALGASGKILTSNGTDPVWGDGPLTTRGDLIRAGASGAIQRVALGASGKILTSDGTDAVWGNGPLTTKGDLVAGGTSGAIDRLPVGTDGYLLKSNSAASLGVSWVNPTGAVSANIYSPDYPPAAANSDDDEFEDSSLAGAWTTWDPGSKLTVTEVAHGLNFSYVAANGSYNVAGIYKTLAAGDFSVMTKIHVLVTPASYFFAGLLLGQDLVSSPNTSDIITFGIYQGVTPSAFVIQADRWTQYNGAATSQASQAVTYPFSTLCVRIRRIGANLSYDYSVDGMSWVTMATVAEGFTAIQYGVCANANNNKTSVAVFPYFRRVTTTTNVPVLGRRL